MPDQSTIKEFTRKDLYHFAQKNETAKNLAIRPSVKVASKIGPYVHLLMDYDLSTSGKRYHTSGCLAVFDNLSEREYEAIADSEIRKHGRNKIAEMATAKRLLARDDVVFVYRDDKVMAHPKMKEEFPDLKGKDYSGSGPCAGADEERIHRHFIVDRDWPVYVDERDLEGPEKETPHGSPSL